LPSDDKGEQKTFMAAMRDFEELCDQMYLVVESARDALLQRVNDTHSLADEGILARTQACGVEAPICHFALIWRAPEVPGNMLA
jgi:hypothetical protein